MAIAKSHIPYYEDILGISGLLRDPVLIFGVQRWWIAPYTSTFSLARRRLHLWLNAKRWGMQGRARYRPVSCIPQAFQRESLNAILNGLGAEHVMTLDAFDPQADIIHDMNTPVDKSWIGFFNTVIDIGCLEHVFDTRQCLANLFGMLRIGGHLVLHTPCKGYYGHGYHTFSPECITDVLTSNGFEIRYLKFSSRDGFELDDPDMDSNVLIWVVAKKAEQKDCFVVPQQGRWSAYHP